VLDRVRRHDLVDDRQVALIEPFLDQPPVERLVAGPFHSTAPLN